MNFVYSIQQYNGFNSDVTSACFSYGDERYVFAGSHAGTIVVWDIEAQKVAMNFKEHLSQCVCICAQREVRGGNYVVSGSLDTNVKVWDLRSKRSIMTLKSHAKPITSVDISIDGRVVASGSHDSYVKIWENSSARCIFQLKQNSSTSAVTSIALNPKDMTIASGHSDRYIRYWDLDQGNMISVTTPPDTTPAQKLWFTDDGRHTFAGTMDSIKVWDLEKAQLADIIMKPQSVIYDMRGNSDYFYLAEYNSVNSSVILSQIPMDEVNTKGTVLPSSMTNDVDDSIGSSTDSKQLDFYHSKMMQAKNSGPHARMQMQQQNHSKQSSSNLRNTRGQGFGTQQLYQSNNLPLIAGAQNEQPPVPQKSQHLNNFAKNGLNILNKKGETGTNFYRPPQQTIQEQPDEQQHTISKLALSKQSTEQKLFKDSLEDFNSLLKQSEMKIDSPNPKAVEATAQDTPFSAAEKLMRITATTNLSSLYEIPIDKPLNIDLNKFLQPKDDLTNDIDIINEAMKQHPMMENILSRRQRNIKVVQKWLLQGNINSTINTLSQLNDLSVVNDFIGETFASNQKLELLTMENAPAILGHCLSLVNSRYEAHITSGVKGVGNIFNVFRDRIMQAKSVIINERFVDLERENRMQRFDIMIDLFERCIQAPGWDRALKSQSQQLRELASRHDNDIDFFIEKCKKGPEKAQSSNFAANGVAAGGYQPPRDSNGS